MKPLEITTEGQIKELSVIGFHGEVDARYTPGRQGPIYMDDGGRLARIERVEPPSKQGEAESPARAWLVLGPPAAQGIPGVATRIARPLPAFLEHFFVVVGDMEREYAQALLEVGPHVDDQPRVEAFLKWLAGQAPHSEELRAERLGTLGAWYCTLAEANALYRRIAHVAEKAMGRACVREDERVLYQMSWWRSRVAMSDEDRYFAAVGLERSDRSMADAYLQAVFRRKPREELEAGLEHARRQFDSLCEQERRSRLFVAEADPPVDGSTEGSGRVVTGPRPLRSSVRQEVRGPQIVQRKAA
jgi:hypothetical protein